MTSCNSVRLSIPKKVCICFTAWLVSSAALFVQADDALFIGNSYTYGGSDKPVSNHGGVPKVVELIAASKGKTLSSDMLTVGGKDWGYHLQQPVTQEKLNLKNWDWVVLQDFSLSATHQGSPVSFMRNGETFYYRIRITARNAKVVLYETWARAPGHDVYKQTNGVAQFKKPAEMDKEIQANYARLARKLESLEPGKQVLLAPVGAAFERCRAKHPEIDLYSRDKHHAGTLGSYLAGLVIYSTVFHDSCKGATMSLFGTTVDPLVAEKLQHVADKVTSHLR